MRDRSRPGVVLIGEIAEAFMTTIPAGQGSFVTTKPPQTRVLKGKFCRIFQQDYTGITQNKKSYMVKHM